jgi:hypothetical protein
MKSPLSLLVILLSIVGCSSPERRLSEKERLDLGLTGVIYDARICPSEFDPQTQKLRVGQKCELVTCERDGTGIECKAIQERP